MYLDEGLYSEEKYKNNRGSTKFRNLFVRPLPVYALQNECRLADRVLDCRDLRWTRPVRIELDQLASAQESCSKKDCVFPLLVHLSPPAETGRDRIAQAFEPVSSAGEFSLAKPTPTLKQTLEALRRQALVGKSYFNLARAEQRAVQEG